MRVFVFLFLCLGLATPSLAQIIGGASEREDLDLEAILTTARSFLAEEEVLRGVRTIRFRGLIQPRGAPEPSEVTIDFERPNLQRISQETADNYLITIVNRFEGFVYQTSKETGEILQVRVLSSDEVAYYQQNARENLNFYLGPRTVPGGSIELAGQTIRRGIPVYRVTFHYPSGGNYDRYFDRETLDLVLTTVGRDEIDLVQSGEQYSGGIRFPESLATYSADGHLIHEMTFEEIQINLDFPEGHFQLPEDLIFHRSAGNR